MRLSHYLRCEDRFFYIRTKDDIEVNLLIERSRKELWAIEIKSAEQVDESEIRVAAILAKDLKVTKFIVASREKQKRVLDGFEIWPWQDVMNLLY